LREISERFFCIYHTFASILLPVMKITFCEFLQNRQKSEQIAQFVLQ